MVCGDPVLAGVKVSSFDKSMLKVERREMGGRGEDKFRPLGGNCPARCVPLEAPCASLPFGIKGTFSVEFLSCATLSPGLGADTCRFPSFAVSDPRFGRRRLLDLLGSQFPGEESVIDMERFVRCAGVSAGVALECLPGPSGGEPFETGLSSTGLASRSGAAGLTVPGCVRYTAFSALSLLGEIRFSNPPEPSVALAVIPRTLTLMEREWKKDVHPVGKRPRGWSRPCSMPSSRGSKDRGGSRSNEWFGCMPGEGRRPESWDCCSVADLWWLVAGRRRLGRWVFARRLVPYSVKLACAEGGGRFTNLLGV